MGESRHFPNGFLDLWAQTIDEGLVPRILITSNRHQMGKTNSMIRIQEKVQEEIHGRKFSIDDLTLECLEYMERRKMVPEWTPLALDEPERPVGNKSNFEVEAQIFVEDLMTSPFRHIPGLFALPHSHYLNFSIFGVATSQIVKTSRTDGEVYEYKRDQLNRSFTTYTPRLGHISFEPAYAWDWAKYINKREAFDQKRGKELEDKMRTLRMESRNLDKDQVYSLVMADLKKFTDPRKGIVSASLVEEKLSVSYASARYAAGKVNQLQREREIAEVGKVSGR